MIYTSWSHSPLLAMSPLKLISSCIVFFGVQEVDRVYDYASVAVCSILSASNWVATHASHSMLILLDIFPAYSYNPVTSTGRSNSIPIPFKILLGRKTSRSERWSLRHRPYDFLGEKHPFDISESTLGVQFEWSAHSLCVSAVRGTTCAY